MVAVKLLFKKGGEFYISPHFGKAHNESQKKGGAKAWLGEDSMTEKF